MKRLALNASRCGERDITARLLARLGEGAQQAAPGSRRSHRRASQSHPCTVLWAAQTPALGVAARGAGVERSVFWGVKE